MTMSQPQLPRIGDLHSYSDLAQTAVLDLLFEPSAAIHSTLLHVIRTNEYASYPELIDSCHIQLLSLAATNTADEANQTLLSVLGSHPRLGEKKVDSAQSAAEQANLGGEGEELAKLNREYEETFPGLRYVVFVNGRGRPEIMEDMRARIDRGDYTKEVDAAIQVRTKDRPQPAAGGWIASTDSSKAMCDIAKDRASKLPIVIP
ncbi:hypothetical protein DCS_03589 [Drechmeria coniospora]|uniref:Oxo-4-hydroxy-4-carboxy-5-ureidoimidazoline decarboxylase domain-containing protein n=1 Tax=Drechmeria coniospora TaxID=98403 RepID=A0A151GHN6_DRECN|nr:hypothetical protein DCS_03589 [Drechmeria coniospora]KYK56588.1 hypothetical protein DCS_03589 [Drechmeria coniospora]